MKPGCGNSFRRARPTLQPPWRSARPTCLPLRQPKPYWTPPGALRPIRSASRRWRGWVTAGRARFAPTPCVGPAHQNYSAPWPGKASRAGPRRGAAALREAALDELRRQLAGGQLRQVEEAAGNLATAMRTADLAWESLTLVMAAAQYWAAAAAKETVAAGMIARLADVLYLELEELKQVATGEWHAGDKEEVQAAVARRMQEAAVAPEPAVVAPLVVSPGECDGPLYGGWPGEVLPPAGAVWMTEGADPGCAAFWPFAGCLITGGGDAWAPGLVAARGLGVPARLGAGPAGV